MTGARIEARARKHGRLPRVALTEPELAAADRYGCGEDHRDRARARGVEASARPRLRSPGPPSIFCCQVAPDAPDAILREAAIRLAGMAYTEIDRTPSSMTFTDPSGKLDQFRSNSAMRRRPANGFRSSGASALLVALHREAPGRSDRLMRWPWTTPRDPRGRRAGTPKFISALIAGPGGRLDTTSIGDGCRRGGSRGDVEGLHGRDGSKGRPMLSRRYRRAPWGKSAAI